MIQLPPEALAGLEASTRRLTAYLNSVMPQIVESTFSEDFRRSMDSVLDGLESARGVLQGPEWQRTLATVNAALEQVRTDALPLAEGILEASELALASAVSAGAVTPSSIEKVLPQVVTAVESVATPPTAAGSVTDAQAAERQFWLGVWAETAVDGLTDELMDRLNDVDSSLPLVLHLLILALVVLIARGYSVPLPSRGDRAQQLVD